MNKNPIAVACALLIVGVSQAQTSPTKYVNPFLGTAPLTDSVDVGYRPPEGWRVWASLSFPGADAKRQDIDC